MPSVFCHSIRMVPRAEVWPRWHLLYEMFLDGSMFLWNEESPLQHHDTYENVKM